MDLNRTNQITDNRTSIGAFSDFSQTEDVDEIDDPISAYFKQRCGNASKTYFKKNIESDRESSIGLIDVDNVSLFGDGEENEKGVLRFSEDMLDELKRDSFNVINDEFDKLKTSISAQDMLAKMKRESAGMKKKKEIDQSKITVQEHKSRECEESREKVVNVKKNKEIVPQRITISEIESELDKQRALAQKALKRLSNITNDSRSEISMVSPGKRQSTALADISSKLMNVKLSMGKTSDKEWFQPNFSPNTPRYFNDELSSFGGGDDENLPSKSELKDFENEEGAKKRRNSHYVKKVNLMLKELSQVPADSDLEFETHTEEEQINRFEEDEKKFKLETSGLLHNSQISQFSGTDEQNFSQWLAESSNLKPETGKQNLSIGQFFNMRSNRVSSLIGSVSDVNSVPILEEDSEASTLTDSKSQHLSKSEYSFPVSEIPPPEQPKIRRCISTYDLKRMNEGPKSVRYSTDSSSSNSTIMIQDILAEMESGLSGTQIYEKLMKSYGKKNEGTENKQPEKTQRSRLSLENKETPKSSKEHKRKDENKTKMNETVIEAKTSRGRNSFASELKGKQSDLKLKEATTTMSPRAVKKKKSERNKEFFSSTPKSQGGKVQNDKFITSFGKVLISDEEWEAPRVHSIQAIDLNKSGGSDENEKTMVNSTTSSDQNKKNNTVVLNNSPTIEDTIVAGDLTVLSERIDQMKRDSVCIVRSAEPEEPVLLNVIQKLADLPKGSLDCSALTPLIRDQFPELLSSFPTPSKTSFLNASSRHEKTQDALVALPGSWVKLPGVWGLKEKIWTCVDLQKTVLVPVVNVSQNWLLLSVESLELIHPQGKIVTGVKKNDDWCVLDFVVVSFKETIVPPDSLQSLKICFKSKAAVKTELILTFRVKELMNGDIQTRSVRLLIHSVHPENYINVLPKDPINFGVIAEQCFDQTTVQVTFEGVSELPLTVYIDEDQSASRHFFLKPVNGQPRGKEWSDNLFRHVFREGGKQVLEFRVCFIPNVLLKEDCNTQDFKATLVIMLGNKTEGETCLQRIPIKGSVGYAKFLCRRTAPLVFRSSEKDQSVTRSYSLINVGSLPIAFNISLMNEDREVIEGEDVFVFPKSFYLSRNEEAAMNITFNAKCNENFTKRFLRLQMKPNGVVNYEVELIGIITSTECRPASRSSATSVSTKTTTKLDSDAVKFLTTAQSLSWAAVSLDKEVRQSFQIINMSGSTISVRAGFDRNLDAFKLVHENGEKVQKFRKVLKNNCPVTVTVSFRPDVVGAHNTVLTFELSHYGVEKRIMLNGIGGIPNIAMRNVKSDLNGCKILRLQPSRVSSQFESEIIFTNMGRIPAFILIKLAVKDFSVSHDLNISPSSVVVYPDSSVTVKISQKLKHNDLQQLLSDKEICKIATICVVTGDEPSRQRIRKLVNTEKLPSSERLHFFTATFSNEKEIQLNNFKDLGGFEHEFLKSLKVHEIAVVIEKNAEIYEPSILEETTDDFISFLSYTSAVCSTKSQEKNNSNQQKSTYSNPLDINATLFSADSLTSIAPHKRITKWLETLDSV